MHLTETMLLNRPPATVFPYVADLDQYPSWMRLVHRAERDTSTETSTDTSTDTSEPAWLCELRAKVGPFARSKRLRMVRTELEQDRFVAFERDETDGRTHARWAMRVTTEPAESSATQLTIELIYDGDLWSGGLLDRVLQDEVKRGRAALQRLVDAENA